MKRCEHFQIAEGILRHLHNLIFEERGGFCLRKPSRSHWILSVLKISAGPFNKQLTMSILPSILDIVTRPSYVSTGCRRWPLLVESVCVTVRCPSVCRFVSPSSFSANPSHCSLSFSPSGPTTWFPRLLLLLLTYLFLLFSFSVLKLLIVVSVR